MGFSETKWGGFAKIIVDTSTMSVGDKVRVKSITTGTNYDKTVATVGTPLLWETEIYKDYVKICMIQTISDVETEIGGVYKTVDYGQTLFINVLDKTTLGGIQGILNAHQETSLLSIGDEVTITVNANPWVMQIAGINIYNSHEVIFTSKTVYTTSNYFTDYRSSSVRQQAQAFYSTIGDNDKQFIKEVTRKCWISGAAAYSYDDYCFVLGNKEIFGGADYSSVSDQVQMPLFTTQNNRIKTYNGTAKWYYTSDYYYNSQDVIVEVNGAINVTGGNGGGVVPSFTLLADS